jgi:hypothetical protein
MNDLGLKQADHDLGQRIVVAVADAADGRLDPGLGQALGVLDADVSGAAITVVDEPGALGRTAIVQGLFEGIENELSLHRPRYPPADDPAREGVE